jgi:hypothetical protein
MRHAVLHLRHSKTKVVIPMAKRFELHLEGMDAPEGLMDADHLVEIVKCLRDLATRIGRIETKSAERGRPNRNLDRVARLRIGLERGSTTIVAERNVADGALIDLPDEEEADRKFAEIMEGIGADSRPSWVTDSIADAAGDLVNALQKTAPKVELKIDGVSKRTFETSAIHRETWRRLTAAATADEITFTGRLFAVNLHTHRLQVQDDVGNQVSRPKVPNDSAVGKLIGSYVTVTGVPDVDLQGKLINISEASIEPAPDPVGQQVRASVDVDEILASAPGPTLGGIAGLTDVEVEAFFEAIG